MINQQERVLEGGGDDLALNRRKSGSVMEKRAICDRMHLKLDSCRDREGSQFMARTHGHDADDTEMWMTSSLQNEERTIVGLVNCLYGIARIYAGMKERKTANDSNGIGEEDWVGWNPVDGEECLIRDSVVDASDDKMADMRAHRRSLIDRNRVAKETHLKIWDYAEYIQERQTKAHVGQSAVLVGAGWVGDSKEGVLEVDWRSRGTSKTLGLCLTVGQTRSRAVVFRGHGCVRRRKQGNLDTGWPHRPVAPSFHELFRSGTAQMITLPVLKPR
ncbi:hypothetical protein C8R44DRAFT_741481 [Mycena epipterygia]|nr:hypothetical protein C8R44DRAFT_741481 [Mycena epipterygia]